jgi:NAD-dependent SIR2 family protein deacetylase
MSNGPMEAFLRDYSKEVEEGNAAVFIGAGLSVPAGFVDWRKLLKTLAQDIGLDADKEPPSTIATNGLAIAPTLAVFCWRNSRRTPSPRPIARDRESGQCFHQTGHL